MANQQRKSRERPKVERPTPETQDAAGPSERSVDPRNQLNDLTGAEWIQETKSFVFQKGLGAAHPHAQIEREHPAPFSYQDVQRLVLFFTKPGSTVLDPFGGVGSTAKACALSGRKSISIELSKKWHDLAIRRIRTEVNPRELTNHQFVRGDSTKILPTMKESTIDFVVTSPPYWSILGKKPDHKAGERVARDLATKYSDDPRDLGNIASYDAFMTQLVSLVSECGRVLAPKKYLALVVSDFRHGNRLFPFHADLTTRLAGVAAGKNHALALQGIKALLQNHKGLKPYGYPFSYVENIHHQYILIFQKQSTDSPRK